MYNSAVSRRCAPGPRPPVARQGRGGCNLPLLDEVVNLSALYRAKNSQNREKRFLKSKKNPKGCNGQIVGQLRKSECLQNVRKCRKCPKNVQKLSRGAENTIFGHFLDIFPIWSMLLFCDPVQCWPVTTQGRSESKYITTPQQGTTREDGEGFDSKRPFRGGWR